MSQKPDVIKEVLARFLEKPTREDFRELVKNQYGEFSHLDFKSEWIDLKKLSKHILGFGNSGGGVILFGISEKADKSLYCTGLKDFLDKSQFDNSIRKFLPHDLIKLCFIQDFSFDDSEYGTLKGKKFQVLIISNEPRQIPFLSEKDGSDIRKTAIYVRRMGSTEEASYEELQELLKRRIETEGPARQATKLFQDLEELEVLYNYIYKNRDIFFAQRLMSAFPSPIKEDFSTFLVRIIKFKKRNIESQIGYDD